MCLPTQPLQWAHEALHPLPPTQREASRHAAPCLLLKQPFPPFSKVSAFSLSSPLVSTALRLPLREQMGVCVTATAAGIAHHRWTHRVPKGMDWELLGTVWESTFGHSY